MNRLEQIKLRMEENLRELREYQEMQLKSYDYLMNLTDIDEVDMEIQYIEEEFKFSTLFKEIANKEKDNLDNLMNLVWEAKTKGEEVNA